MALTTVLGAATAQQRNPTATKNALPEIGVVASDAISIDKELMVGKILMRQLRSQAPIVTDPLLEEYIQDLGNRLVAQAQNVKFPYKFFLLNNQEINAFAFFGGHIGTHTGLIFHASNESELASVLAHEVTHVTQRHIARSIQARQKASPLQIASMFGGLLLALANPEAGVAAISAGNAASAQASINYTRSNEREADRIGLQVLAQAGFDVRGSMGFFDKLLKQSRNRSRQLAFLQTHPLPESRVSDARARVASYPPRRIAPSLSFHLAKTRIIARYYGNPKDNITYFRSALEKENYVFREAAQYGLALALYENEKYGEARKIINSLREGDRENLFYLDTSTDILLALKQYDQAISQLEAQHKLVPLNRVVALNLANAKIKAGKHDDATSLLKDFLLVNPDNYLALQLLSDAYSESQQMLEMHQSKAEVYALVGAYSRAIDELHNAYNFATERKLEKQRIRARIGQLREERNRLKTL